MSDEPRAPQPGERRAAPREDDELVPPTLPAGALPTAAAARRASRAARCFWFWVWRRCLDGCRLVDMARTLGVVDHPGEGGEGCHPHLRRHGRLIPTVVVAVVE